VSAGKRLPFGVIGCGGMGFSHLGGLVKRAEKEALRVVAVCVAYRQRKTMTWDPRKEKVVS
jgi:hypothetical protein